MTLGRSPYLPVPTGAGGVLPPPLRAAIERVAMVDIAETPVITPEHSLDCCDLCASRIEAMAHLVGTWTPIMTAFGELITALHTNPMIAKMVGVEVPTRKERKRAAKEGEPDAG